MCVGGGGGGGVFIALSQSYNVMTISSKDEYRLICIVNILSQSSSPGYNTTHEYPIIPYVSYHIAPNGHDILHNLWHTHTPFGIFMVTMCVGIVPQVVVLGIPSGIHTGVGGELFTSRSATAGYDYQFISVYHAVNAFFFSVGGGAAASARALC